MTEQTAGVSRRRVIQGAAWATPAILIATSAPALAATGDPATASLGAATATATHPSGSGNRHLSASVIITNGADEGSYDLVNVFVVVDLPTGWGTPSSTNGWTYAGAVGPGEIGYEAGRNAYRFTTTTTLAPGDSTQLAVSAVHIASGSITAGVVGFTGGGTSATLGTLATSARVTASYASV